MIRAILLAALALPAPATEYREPDWQLPIGDGHVFVSLGYEGRGIGILRQYPGTGVYPRGSTTPVWTAPVYAWPERFALSADRRYLVVEPGPSHPAALAFYDRGVLVTRVDALPTHRADRLFAALPDRPPRIDGAAFTLGRAGAIYRYDVRTGRLLGVDRSPRMWVVGVLGVAISMALAAWRRRQQRPAGPLFACVAAGVILSLAGLVA